MAATICIKVVVLTAPPLRFELFFFGDFALFFDFLDGDLAGQAKKPKKAKKTKKSSKKTAKKSTKKPKAKKSPIL
jgi:hypothetical protein